MARLVLHIGTHKTATTRIQKMFHKNRALLEQYGVIYPTIGPTEGQHALLSVWNEHMLPDPGFDARTAWESLAANHAGSDRTVLLSSEEFSRMNARRVDLAELRRMTAAFDRVQIVCTLRNQASFVQSVYQQVSGTRRISMWPVFLARCLEQRMADGLPLDYDRFYTHLLTAFAPQDIRFVSYDKAVREEGGIVGACLRELGLPLTLEDLVPVSKAESNISPQPLATLHANRMAKPEVATPELVALLERQLAASFGPDVRTTLYTPLELSLMTELFSPLNEALTMHLRPHQAGFDVGPMLGSGADVYRDGPTEAFWVEICRSLIRNGD